MAEEMKECPKCAEMIKAKAVRCRFCGYTFADVTERKTALERDFSEDIAQFEKEQSKGKKVGKFFLFLFLFLGTGALGWFLTEFGFIDLVYHKLTSGRFKPDLVFLDCIQPLSVREGRLGVEAGGRGGQERVPQSRLAERPVTPRLTRDRTDGAPTKVTRHYVDVNALLNAASFEPDNPSNNYNIGSAYLFNFDNSRAIDYLVKAVTLLPDDYEASTNLAVAYFREQLYDQARREAEKALGIEKGNPLAINILGLYSLKKNLLTEALKQFQSVVEDDPQFVDSYINLGNVYATQDNLTMAKEKFQKALALASGHGVASHNLAVIAYQEGDYQNALKYWEQALNNTLLIDDDAVIKIDRNLKIVKKKLL